MREPKDIKIGDLTLAEIIEKHQHYIKKDCDEWKDMRANLSYTNLHCVNLCNVNLSGAILIDANLSNANLNDACLDSAILIDTNLNDAKLIRANLCYADLFNAKLIRANLCYADLWRADLKDARLYAANLHNANLRYANLHNANLRYANLNRTDLSDTNLSNADLCDTNLAYASLYGSNLRNTNLNTANLIGVELSSTNLFDAILRDNKGKLIEYRKGKVLTESIIGYKKCYKKYEGNVINNVIVTLEIPRGAIVFSINGNKCRTNKAKVLSIDGADRAYATHKYMSYYVGDEFTIYNFNCEYNVECAEGIHFFMTREEAENYYA